MTPARDRLNKPRIGITTGDPAGIGPEVALKAVADQALRSAITPVLIGSETEIRNQARLIGLRCDYPVVLESELDEFHFDRPAICDTDAAGPFEHGAHSAAAARSAILAIEAAVRLTLNHRLDAIATAPINKESLRLAGSNFSGHTDMLASLCGVRESLMCFVADDLKVFLLTTHVSLRNAIESLTRERVVRAIVLADRELRRFGTVRPRIAVAGLNPHAGEHGLFGWEETREIGPAIRQCREAYNVEVSGPFPADTIFMRAAKGEFDAVAACYHDQGLIPVKCLAFGKAVNVTLGLPIIRTSVDHGTAFDIAGKGVANPSSMIEAVLLAARLAQHC